MKLFLNPQLFVGVGCYINKKLTHCSVQISPFLSVCIPSQKCQHPDKGSFANNTKDTAALGPKAFSKNLSSTVEAYNYRAETYATFTSHTIQCVHKLPVEKNIYLGLIVVIKSMM